MKKLNNLQRVILKILVSSSGNLDSYTLFKRSRVNFNDFAKAFEKLSKEKFITEKDNYVSIATKMTLEVKNILTEFEQFREKTWRKTPSEFSGDSININSLYVPSRALLDKKTFNLDKEQVV